MSSEHTQVPVHGDEEVTDRGFFGLGKKKDEKEEEAIVTEVEKLHIEEAEQKKHGLFDKLHRSGSSSSSSSDEEEIGEDGEKKKKKKKGLKEKVEEKLHGEKKEEGEVKPNEDTNVVVEKVEETVEVPVKEEEKKGFLGKIKEKLHKKPAEEGAPAAVVTAPPAPPAVEGGEHHDGEKKGFLEKIKEKLPGYHKSSGEDQSPTSN